MPGHSSPSADREAFQANSLRLDELIQSHDVVFALTDSREARWLPTVMCSAHDKVGLSCCFCSHDPHPPCLFQMLINAALGFDSYLVMRHGHSVTHSNPADDRSISLSPFMSPLTSSPFPLSLG
jgi:ubiquitin-like modifier-activating enzyme ATG7